MVPLTEGPLTECLMYLNAGSGINMEICLYLIFEWHLILDKKFNFFHKNCLKTGPFCLAFKQNGLAFDHFVYLRPFEK